MSGGNVTFKVDADTAQAVQKFLGLEDRQKALEAQAARVGAASKAQHDEGRRGAEDHGAGIEKLVGKYGTLAGGIGAVTAQLRAMNAERERAAASEEAATTGMGALAQFPGYARNKAEAIKSMREVGMSEAEAGGLQFALVSSGKESERAMYASLYGITDPTALAGDVSTLQHAMGAGEVGGDRQALAKLFFAASAGKTSVSALARAAARVGPVASMVGASDEELLASLASLSKGELGIEGAASGLEAFLSGAIRSDQIRPGGGIQDIVAQVQAMGPLGDRVLGQRLGVRNLDAIKTFRGMAAGTGERASLLADLVSTDRRAATGEDDLVGARVGAFVAEEGGVRGAQSAERRAMLGEAETFGAAGLRGRQVKADMLNLARKYGLPTWPSRLPGADFALSAIAGEVVDWEKDPLGKAISSIPTPIPLMSSAMSTVAGVTFTIKAEDQRNPQNRRLGGGSGTE